MTNSKRIEKTHPSYGMISVHRVHNTRARLFGSALEAHYGTIRLSIGDGTWIHEDGIDRYHGDLHGRYIEIEMSSAQFAEAITSMNVGCGVPCTIRRLHGKLVPEPPIEETEAVRIRKDFAGSIKAKVATMEESAKRIRELVARLPAKTRTEIDRSLHTIVAQLSDNIPWAVELFKEATERVVSAAKHEIEAFFGHAARAAGVKTIEERPEMLPQALLGTPDDDDADLMTYGASYQIKSIVDGFVWRRRESSGAWSRWSSPVKTAEEAEMAAIDPLMHPGPCADIKGDGTCYGCGARLGGDS